MAAALDAIASGELAAGDQLPLVRGLAAEVLVNANTETNAYRDLEHLAETLAAVRAAVQLSSSGF